MDTNSLIHATKLLDKKKEKIYPPEKLNYENFIGNTSISTSTMIIEKK